jgi:MscS family membrane protein
VDPSAWSEFFATPVGRPLFRLGGLIAVTLAVVVLLEGIYRIVFRRLALRTAGLTDDRVFRTIHGAIRLTVIIGSIDVGFRLMGAPEAAIEVVSRICRSLAILAWTGALVRVLSDLLRAGGRQGRFSFLEQRTVPLFDTIQKVVLVAGAAYLFFLTWNIDVTAWAASAGILGIAVGFAAKDTLANLFSGVFILVDAPYRIGDMILLDTGERGLVTEVGIRSTRIVTRDDVEITIPNSQIGAAKVTNESGGPYRKRRVDVKVGVSYASDPDRVRAALMAVAGEVDEVCRQPEPRVRFREMADSALIFSLLFWIDDPEQRGSAVDAVNTRILQRFRADGIEIPFPQRVVHFPAASSPPLTE